MTVEAMTNGHAASGRTGTKKRPGAASRPQAPMSSVMEIILSPRMRSMAFHEAWHKAATRTAKVIVAVMKAIAAGVLMAAGTGAVQRRVPLFRVGHRPLRAAFRAAQRQAFRRKRHMHGRARLVPHGILLGDEELADAGRQSVVPMRPEIGRLADLGRQRIRRGSDLQPHRRWP